MKNLLLLLVISLLVGCSINKRIGGEQMSYIKEGYVEEFDVEDIFKRYKRENNSGLEMSGLTDKFKKFYDRYVEEVGGREEVISFSDSFRMGNLAFSRYSIKEYGKDGILSGWLVVEVEGGKIDFFANSVGGPPVEFFRYGGEVGQLADVGSTAVAISQSGIVEGNPIMGGIIDGAGIPGLALVKVGGTYFAKNYSIESCITSLGMLEGMGWGAAAWNIGLVAGMGPVGIVPALAAGYVAWPEKNEVFWNCIPEEAGIKIAGIER